MGIKPEAKNGQQHQKWLFAVSEINKIRIGFIQFSVESKFKLTFKGWHRPVCHFFGFTRVSSCKNSVAFHPLTVKRIVTGLMPSLLFRCFVSFSASFKNSSPRERSEICFRFATSGPSLFLYPLLSRNIILSPATLTMAARTKTKISGKAICSRHQRALSRFGARLRILNLIAWLC